MLSDWHPRRVTRQGLLAILGEMRVRYLVLTAMKPVVSMWRRSFGFVPLAPQALRALEDRCACDVPRVAMPRQPFQPILLIRSSATVFCWAFLPPAAYLLLALGIPMRRGLLLGMTWATDAQDCHAGLAQRAAAESRGGRGSR